MKKNRRIGRISLRRTGDIVRLQMYSAHDNHDKFFDMEAPANNPKKVKLLLEAARNKGLSLSDPEDFDSEEPWW